MSRNRFIVQVLERALAETDDWSPEFLAALDELVPDAVSRGADELLATIMSTRSSKRGHPL